MMSWTNFYQSVNQKIESCASSKAIWLQPSLDRIPLPIQRFDEPFLPLSKAIIKATQDKVAIYIFDFASYLSIGAAGAVALERAIAYANYNAITILHGPFSGNHYGILGDEISFNVKALTVTSHEDLDYYTTHPPYAAFLYMGSRVKKGGIMRNHKLVLSNPKYTDIGIDVFDTNTLLHDLSDTYIDSIRSSFS
jgi:hypothetical protein